VIGGVLAPLSGEYNFTHGRAFGVAGHDLRGLVGTAPPTCAIDVDGGAWWTLEGTQHDGWLGSSVSTADLNRDGFDDVIVGESGHDIPPPSGPATGSNRGQVSIGLSTQDIP